MGYRKKPTIYTLDFEGTELNGLVVRLKSVRLGEIRKIVSTVGADEDSITEAEIDSILGLLERNLVSWNLEDEDGTPVPSDASGLNDQEFPLIMKIMETWLEGMTGVSDDLGKGSGSGETSRVPLPPMEAL